MKYIKKNLLLLYLYIKYIIVLDIYYNCVYIWNYILFLLKKYNVSNSNEMFNYKIKFKFNKKIFIKIMRCKIVEPVYVAQYYKVNQKSKKFRFYIIV